MKAVIIGTGAICGCHVHALKECGVEIIAVCDIDLDKAKNFCATQNLNCAVYGDWKKMLDEQSADVVHICTPHYLHEQMAIYALSKNINVFLKLAKIAVYSVNCAREKVYNSLCCVFSNLRKIYYNRVSV